MPDKRARKVAVNTARRFATDYNGASTAATDGTKRRFNTAVFNRIELCYRQVVSQGWRAPFHVLPNAPEFQRENPEEVVSLEPMPPTLLTMEGAPR